MYFYRTLAALAFVQFALFPPCAFLSCMVVFFLAVFCSLKFSPFLFSLRVPFSFSSFFGPQLVEVSLFLPALFFPRKRQSSPPPYDQIGRAFYDLQSYPLRRVEVLRPPPQPFFSASLPFFIDFSVSLKCGGSRPRWRRSTHGVFLFPFNRSFFFLDVPDGCRPTSSLLKDVV